ncbi:hypothetical protein VKT23_007439 [Stygiomarasmius scandens]|uniref:UbiA prenyltransferase n=1 Tax=Marasmiellus scandens TaxID=2682957 RepID=A0ABR1JMN9_9AGAR
MSVRVTEGKSTISFTNSHSVRLRYRFYLSSCLVYGLVPNIIRIGYAFTKSDFKTIVGPVICYGLLAAPTIHFGPTVKLAIWVWLHLLQFCAANQTYSQDEDALNKPYRPIPAGLIDVQTTRILRWSLVPVCLSLSWIFDVIYPGLSLVVSFILYNELGLDSRWYSKNLLNAIGIVSWNVGAAAITRQGLPPVNEMVWLAPYISIALIWMTIHVQDFRDEEGDKLQGRITLPTLLPETSRSLTAALLIFWSIALGIFWNLGPVVFSIFALSGTCIAARIFWRRTEAEDKISLRYYMASLCIVEYVGNNLSVMLCSSGFASLKLCPFG